MQLWEDGEGPEYRSCLQRPSGSGARYPAVPSQCAGSAVKQFLIAALSPSVEVRCVPSEGHSCRPGSYFPSRQKHLLSVRAAQETGITRNNK